MKFVQLKDESDQAVVSPMSRMHPPYDAPVYVEESFPAWFDGGPINLQVASIPGVFGNTADGLDRHHGNPRSLIVGCLVVSASVRRSHEPCRPRLGSFRIRIHVLQISGSGRVRHSFAGCSAGGL